MSSLASVRPIVMETPAEGGAVTESTPTETNTLTDALAAAGLFVNGPSVTVADKTVCVDRTTGGNLRFTDQVTQRLLAELVTSISGSVNAHDALRDIQHFLAGEGPGTGFASGSYCSLNYSGPLLTNTTWWTSSAMQTKIFSTTYAYSQTSPVPSTVTYVIYSSTGAAVHTVTDALTYTGPICTGMSRTWS